MDWAEFTKLSTGIRYGQFMKFYNVFFARNAIRPTEIEVRTPELVVLGMKVRFNPDMPKDILAIVSADGQLARLVCYKEPEKPDPFYSSHGHGD